MPDAALALLQAHGYAVRFRNHEWVECLVTRDEEAWVGRGPDRNAALETAMVQACPSALAQALFRRALSEQEATEPRLSASAPTPRPPPRFVPRSHPPLVSKEVPAALTIDRAVDELAVLKERIRASREELGLCTPERQRLAILAWICEARAHTESFSADARVRDAVASISRILTETGKAFWPGSVTALQLQMTPLELPRHQLGTSAPTWTRAAELAEAALQAAVLRDDAQGHDAYGWADGAQLWPHMREPGERLRRLQHDIEQVGGPLQKHAAPKASAAKPDPGTYLRWVRELRWLRGSGVEPERWARLAGRVRWWGGRRDGSLQAGTREFDPSYGPERAWSEVLGERHEAHTEHEYVAQDHFPTGLVDRVRARTRGKRLVWVGPRRDPTQLQALERTLHEANLDWRISETSRLPELGAHIEEGRYDLVLGALGLQAKAPDLALAIACRRSQVGYVRVFRGEMQSCLRGLDRALATL